jgi:hypothetical protein
VEAVAPVLDESAALEDVLAGEQDLRYGANRAEVGARIGVVRADLLGRQVVERADQDRWL